MLRVGVIFGGASSEYEVSLRSATCVLENLDPKKYEIVMIGISRKGHWYHYTGPVDWIASDRWETSAFAEPAVFSPDPQHGGLVLLGRELRPSEHVRRGILKYFEAPEEEEKEGMRTVPLDVVFPVLHGKNGEDGTVQGLLELAKIPYVGCGVASSAICMDKEFSHLILKSAGIPKTKLLAFHHCEAENFVAIKEKVEEELTYPVFVKPANAGSSVGVSKVKAPEELAKAIRHAFEFDSKVVVENAVVGREIECAVWGNKEPHASFSLGEIVPTREFYDYEGKYLDDSTGLIAPAELPSEIVSHVRELAEKAYATLECRGLARVDFFVQEDGSPILNEVNTLPGFTSISMYPRLFQEDGFTIPQILERLIGFALESE